MKQEFSDNVVIITGALSPLGSALVFRFAAEGASVIACLKGEISRSDELMKLCGQRALNSVYPYSLDITNTAQVEEVVAQVTSRFKHIDILINNAGIQESSPFMMLEEPKWKAILDTNILGAERLCAAVSRPMMLQHSGTIVNISSILGTILGRGSAAYAVSKAGLNRLTQVMAVELGKKGIRVNAVAPGLLEKGMGDNLHPEAEKIALDRTPLGRRGTLDEIVEAVLFLASSRSSYITGHILTVDGGVSCG
jgi:3-oxoacyl-[acyl-carrier protein] reductase